MRMAMQPRNNANTAAAHRASGKGAVKAWVSLAEALGIGCL